MLSLENLFHTLGIKQLRLLLLLIVTLMQMKAHFLIFHGTIHEGRVIVIIHYSPGCLFIISILLVHLLSVLIPHLANLWRLETKFDFHVDLIIKFPQIFYIFMFQTISMHENVEIFVCLRNDFTFQLAIYLLQLILKWLAFIFKLIDSILSSFLLLIMRVIVFEDDYLEQLLLISGYLETHIDEELHILTLNAQIFLLLRLRKSEVLLWFVYDAVQIEVCFRSFFASNFFL